MKFLDGDCVFVALPTRLGKSLCCAVRVATCFDSILARQEISVLDDAFRRTVGYS